MADDHSSTRDTPAPPTRRRDGIRGPLAPHHRRRRLAALLAVAVVALVVGVVAGASGGGGHGARRPALPGGYLSRIRTLAGTGPGSFATAEQRAENNAVDRTLAYTPYVRMAGTQHREIALTFDDGPGPYTPQVLAVLARLHVQATFFEVGIAEQYFHDSTSAIVARGYPIGDHTFNHESMSHLSPRAQQRELLLEASAIGAYGAPFPHMFRPPYGDWDNATLALLRKYRMLMVLWSVDTDDWQQPGVAAIVRAAIDGAKPGAIILMHDAGGSREETVEALPKIIEALRQRGYRLVTVPRLLLDNPAPKQQDVASLQGAGG